MFQAWDLERSNFKALQRSWENWKTDWNLIEDQPWPGPDRALLDSGKEPSEAESREKRVLILQRELRKRGAHSYGRWWERLCWIFNAAK